MQQFHFYKIGQIRGGGRGAGARENRGRKGYGRRARKGQEAGVLKEREVGREMANAKFFNST